MAFSKKVKEEALIKSKRCCCICNEFCGRNCVIHHIKQETQGGSNKIANAIVLCQNCHGEVGHYNPNHPIGNKYSPSEIKKHRNNWWQWVEKHPHKTPPKYPISVSPDVINISSGEWKENFKFNLQNRNNQVYYQITLKIFQLPSDFNPKDIAIEIISNREDYSITGKGIQVDWDMIGVWGKDEEGHTAIILWLSSLNPRDTCTFLFSKQITKGKSASSNTKVLFEVCGFSEEPSRILAKNGRIAFPFKLYENFKLQGTLLKIKRNG